MNGCLRCIGLGIDDYVAFFYARLWLEPWDSYARKRREANKAAGYPPRELDRQTGRTTHGLLEAIALYGKQNATYLAVNTTLMIRQATDLARRLGVPVQVVAAARGVSNTVTYEDHYHG